MNKIELTQDKILLRWDGALPPAAPRSAIHEDADVLPFWKNLDGFARWSKRECAFVMAFGKQNIKRLVAEFGQLPISFGKQHLAELKAKQERLVKQLKNIEKAKTMPFEQLPKYDYKMDPLGQYQHRLVVFLRNTTFAALFADCGMGKTFAVLVSTEIQINKGELPRGRTLICGKLATLETGWLEDAAKFTNLKVINLWLPQMEQRKEEIIRLINTPADVYLINHDGLRIFKDELVKKQFLKIAVDESTILKNFRGENPRIQGGQFGKALMEVARWAIWRVAMSGTPAPNGPKDLWGQFRFLDPAGLLLEPSFRDFMHEYYQVIDLRPKAKRYRTIDGVAVKIPLRPRDPHTEVPKKDAIDRIRAIIEPASFRLKLRDHIKDLPELTSIVRTVEMGKEQTRLYKDMEEKLKVEIEGERITATVKLAKIMKLRQLTSGFVIDHQEKPHALPQNAKVEELDDLIESELPQDEKVIIYCQFQWEVEMIALRYKSHKVVTVYGGNSSKKNLENIKAFREDPKIRICILHPKSAAHGITFVIAHYMIFFSFDHSAEDNYQCIRRIERPGQKFPMFVYFLMCVGTIDQQIHRCIDLKQLNQADLIDQPKVNSKLLQMFQGGQYD